MKAPVAPVSTIQVALHSNSAPTPEVTDLEGENISLSSENMDESLAPSAGAANANASDAAEKPFMLPPKEPPYIPAAEVDVRAQPVSPVIVPFPDAALEKPKGTAILALYINTHGEVERVEIEKSELPPAFEQAAIDAFKQAQMYPAVKNGTKVKSRMKVLVEFESK